MEIDNTQYYGNPYNSQSIAVIRGCLSKWHKLHHKNI